MVPKYDNQVELQVSLKPDSSGILIDCITDSLSDNINYRCNICDINTTTLAPNPTATITHNIETLPHVLWIQFKRLTGDATKNNIDVTFDTELVTNFVTHATDGHYILQAVIPHEGDTISNGHYYVHLRTNSGWFTFDDINEEVTPLSDYERLDPQAYIPEYLQYQWKNQHPYQLILNHHHHHYQYPMWN